MHFTKMHGAGNDFIIINNMKENIPEEKLSGIAKKLCARRMSVGADGFMAVVPAKNGGDYGMLFYNTDGSLGEMCGNGARCIARYGYENGLAGETQHIETTSGTVIGTRVDERRYRIRLNDPSIIDLHRSAEAGGTVYDCGYVELGNPGLPHAIVHLPGWDEMDPNTLRELGRALRFSPAFPKGANVSFIGFTGKDELKAVTFERGVEDFTLACGTGCGSIATVTTLLGEASGCVKIHMPGGDLEVTITPDDAVGAHDVYLTGPTCIVCEGETVEALD